MRHKTLGTKSKGGREGKKGRKGEKNDTENKRVGQDKNLLEKGKRRKYAKT